MTPDGPPRPLFGRHDVVFLLTIEAAVAEGSKPDASLPFPSQVGLTCVRGAEVISVADEEGNVYTGAWHTQPALALPRPPSGTPFPGTPFRVAAP